MIDKNELAELEKKVEIYVKYRESNPSKSKAFFRGKQEDQSLETCNNFLNNLAIVKEENNGGYHNNDNYEKLTSAHNSLCGNISLIQKINNLAEKYQKIFDKVQPLDMRAFATQVENSEKNTSANAKEKEIYAHCKVICDSGPGDKSAHISCKFLYNELPMFILSKQYSLNFQKLLTAMGILDDEDKSSKYSCTIS